MFGISNLFNTLEDSEEILKRIVGIPTTWANTDFLNGREWWINSKGTNEGGNLENYLVTYPFENYDIIRGHISFNKFNSRKDTTRKVGLLKAVIRITMKNPGYDEEYNKFAKQIKVVNDCVIRLYVIKVCDMSFMTNFLSLFY